MDYSCKYPWTWVNIKVQNDKWRFCCKVPYQDYDKHQETLTEVKKSFLAQGKSSVCNACWIPESKQYQSYRLAQGGAVSHEKIIKIYNQQPSLEWIDVEFGDTCNMYCLTCGPSNSSLWQQILKIYPNENDKFNEAWPRLISLINQNIKSLGHINLYGGEPSLDTNFYKIVEHLLEYKPEKPIGIQIYTNGNYSDNHRIKFEQAIQDLNDSGWKVRLNFSLDAIGDDVEFIRGGLIFKRFEKNLLTMINKGYVPYINISISVLNIENHVKIYTWLKEKGIADKVIPKFNSVSNPREFNVSILGNKIKDFTVDYPDELINDHWRYFKQRIDNFINVETTATPDKIKIDSLINKILQLEKIKGSMPVYYKQFVDRLSNMCL
jgi:hypothetical protein